MPKIPLADIPNAPAVGPMPALVQPPGFRVNTTSLAQDLMQAPVNPDPFVKAAGAGTLIGDSVRKAGEDASNVFLQLAQKLRESKDRADIARADNYMANAKAAYSKEILDLPEDQWVALWEEKYRPELELDIDSLKLTQWAGERIMPEYKRFELGVRTNSAYDAHKAQLARDEQAHLNRIERARNEGDYPAMFSAIDDWAEVHATPEKREAMIQRETETIKNMRIDALMVADPHGLIQELQTDKLKVSEDRKTLLIHNATKQISKQEEETDDELSKRLESGQLRTEEEIRAWGKAKNVPQRIIESHVKGLKYRYDDSLAGQARLAETRLSLQAKIAEYDPYADVSREDYFRLKDMIHEMLPPGERREFINDLSSLRNKSRTPSRRMEDGIIRRIYAMKRGQFFGPDGDPESNLKASARAQALIRHFQEYKAASPKLTDEEANKWLDRETKGDIETRIRERAFFPGTGGKRPTHPMSFREYNSLQSPNSPLLKRNN